MSFHHPNYFVRAACLLCPAVLMAHLAWPQSVQTVRSEAAPVQRVVSLDASSAYESANRPVVQGEASFANAPANFYAFSSAHAGELSSTESVKLRFDAATTITRIESTKDFTIESGGSCVEGQSYGKGDTCIVLMRFTPQGPGARLGKLTVSNTASVTPATIGLGGNGYSAVVSFTPSIITTVTGTYVSGSGLLSNAHDLKDPGDTLYIADTGNNTIREIDSSGTISNLAAISGTGPASVAVDTFGYIYALSVSGDADFFAYYPPMGGYTYYFTTYKEGTCTVSTPCVLGNVGMENPGSITIDYNNNLFVDEGSYGAMEAPVAGLEGEGILPAINVWYLHDAFSYVGATPGALGVDFNQNLYSAYPDSGQGVCYIVQEPLYQAEGTTPNYVRVAGASKCGFSGDGGEATNAEIGSAIGEIAFDLAGDLYFTDTSNQRVRMINVANGMISTIAGNGTAGYTGDNGTGPAAELSYPTGLAVDSQGQVYIISGTGTTSGGAQVVRKLGVKGDQGFGSQLVGTTSVAHVLTMTNTGNSSLSLTKTTFTGAHPTEFSVDPNTTTCVLTAGSILYAGQSCKIGFLFKPAATGARTANFVLLDNTVTGSNLVMLSGTGTSSAVKLNPGAVTFPATVQSYTTTSAVTLTNTGNAALKLSSLAVGGTNAASFSSTSGCGTSVAPGATCTLHVTFKPSSTGSYAATLKVTDNAPNSPQSIALKGSGVTTVASTIKLAPAANPAAICQPVSFGVTVGGTGAGTPTGTITLKSGATVLATGTLSGGAATLSTTRLTTGTSQVTATYGGDATHEPSTSAELAQTVSTGTCTVAKTGTLGALP